MNGRLRSLTAILGAAVAACCVLVAPAEARNPTPAPVTAKHDKDVLRFYANHPVLALTPAGKLSVFTTRARISQRQADALTAQLATPIGYARHLAARKGWYGPPGSHGRAEWDAITAIVGNESAWNPCSHYPRTSDCFYTGSYACGVPQANPCPAAWRGRLGASWREQVEWLIGTKPNSECESGRAAEYACGYFYWHGYGDPLGAYAHAFRGGYYYSY